MACNEFKEEVDLPPTSISSAMINQAYTAPSDVILHDVPQVVTSMTSYETSDMTSDVMFHYSVAETFGGVTSQLPLPLPSYDPNYVTSLYHPSDAVTSQFPLLAPQETPVSKGLKRRRLDSNDVELPEDLRSVIPFKEERGEGLETRLNSFLEANFPGYNRWHRELSAKKIIEIMMEEYSNPPSVCSTQDAANKKNPKTVLKLEKSKKGQIDVKAGNRIWDSMPLDLREDVESYLDAEPENPDQTGKGERIFSEVKVFFDHPTEHKVKDLRASIPKAVLLLFHTDQVAEGREKIRDMWVPAAKPTEWQRDIPFVDPNNGNKLQKSDLQKVFKFLKTYFQFCESDIRKTLCLDAVRGSEWCPWQQKVMSALKRTERELSNVLKKMDLSHNVEVALKDMKAFLVDMPVQDEEAVLRAFDATSAVQRLMLEIEMARKPAEKIVATCNIIRGTFEDHGSKIMQQPTSSDVGQCYVHSMEESGQQLFHTNDQILGLFENIPAKDEIEDYNFLTANPGSTVQTVTSNSLDNNIRSPQILIQEAQSSQTFQPMDNETDILEMICKSIDLDERDVCDVPLKKMKIEESSEMKSELTILNVSEVGNYEPAAVNSEELFLEVANSRTVQDIVDQLQASVQNPTLNFNNNTYTTEESGSGIFDKLLTQPQPAAPATRMTAVEIPMIPACVESIEMEID